MPHFPTSKGQGTPIQNGMHGSDHPCKPAHGLGIINHLHPEGKWWATSVFRSLWPQWGHLLWSSQDTHCRGSCPWVANSCYFTKLDAHHRYWLIVLDQDSSLLTTINSPFGRYHFLHLPFCLVCFSRHLPEEDGPDPRRVPRMHWNCRWHHCPWSYQSRTWHLPAEPHACCLQIWVSIQPTRNTCKGPNVTFFGCLYDADGVQLDLDKIDAVHALPVPTNITELQEFLGMVMYLSPFIHGLSTLTAPLCELLKKDTDFTGMPPMRLSSSMSRMLLSAMLPSGTLILHFQWQSRLMPHR